MTAFAPLSRTQDAGGAAVSGGCVAASSIAVKGFSGRCVRKTPAFATGAREPVCARSQSENPPT